MPEAQAGSGRRGRCRLRLVLYFISDESAYSTGAEFVVDGGVTV
jgi:hypothetical protein